MELPESPRWLILKGREDEAMSVLAALSGKARDDKFVYNEFLAIKDAVIESEQGSFKDLFTMDRDRNLHRVILAYVNQMFQQISGMSLCQPGLEELGELDLSRQASTSLPTMLQQSTKARSASHHPSRAYSAHATAPSTSSPRG